MRAFAAPGGNAPPTTRPPTRPACHPAVVAALAWLLHGPAAHAQPTPAVPPPERETPREFLDSLADNALAPDPKQLYRRNGARREVDLGGGASASLDERPPTRIDSAVPLPGQAGAPSRVLGLSLRRPGLFGDAGYSRSSTVRDTAASLQWQLAPSLQLRTDVHDQRSRLSDIDARRRDIGAALRWSLAPGAWVDAGVHRATIEPDSGAATGSRGDENFWRGRAQWEPARTPGLRLSAQAERAITRPPGELGAGRLEFGADYTLQADNALSPSLAGARLVWREALRLGLLSEGQALDARAAYRRTLGVELPDGSRDGTVYGQWRQRSVADDADAVLVLGWRHSWLPAPRWLVQGHVEQATPLAGPSPVRSVAVGARVLRNAFPANSFAADLEVVNSDRDDSLYADAKYTFRWSENVLAALRGELTRVQPHAGAQAGTSSYKTALALGWREPDARLLAVLGRWTLTGTKLDAGPPADRRAHIVLGGANLDLGDGHSVSGRYTQRWERDETQPTDGTRMTRMALARWVHELGPLWSVSAHAARRQDDREGDANGAGAELGLRLSRKAVLALGYNPRGFSDRELEVDERLQKGLTLRLRFSIDGALGRWLDTPMKPGE
jgi:hypothetical protein